MKNMENGTKLTDEEKKEIAEMAAKIAYSRFYEIVGESVIKKAIFILGAAAFSAWFFLSNGELPK